MAHVLIGRLALIGFIALFFLASRTTAASGSQIVALGDSYTSGEGAGDYYASAGRCHRSRRAWPILIGVKPEAFLACLGAKTANVLTSPQKPDTIPQLMALERVAAADPDTTVVMAIGGNDLGFKGKIASCRANPAGCLKSTDRLDEELAYVTSRLLATYRAVIRTPGVTRLIVVGYPDIAVPAKGRTHRCGWLTESKRRNIIRFSRMLDKAIHDAADDAGARYISIRGALAGHEMCAKDPYVQPLTRGGHNPLDQQQGHPNAKGQRLMANAIRRELARPATRRPSQIFYLYVGHPKRNWMNRSNLSGPPSTVKVIDGEAGSLAVQGHYMVYIRSRFVGNADYQDVMLATTDGKRAHVLALDTGADSLAVAGEYVYYSWAKTTPFSKLGLIGGIGRVRLDGSRRQDRFVTVPQDPVSGGFADELAVDGGFLYYAQCFQNYVGRVRLDGRENRANWARVSDQVTRCPQTIAAYNGMVYVSGFVGQDTDHKTLSRIDATTGIETPQFLDPVVGAGSIWAGPQGLFWSSEIGERSVIVRAALDATAAAPLPILDASGPIAIR